MSESGQVLRIYNEKIVKCLNELKTQRSEIKDLIDKQVQEKTRLQNEIERITYKLMIITKSVAQRISTLEDYDRTIKEAEEQYYVIVNDSQKLVDKVQKCVENLEEKMDKKTGTDSMDVNAAKEILIEKRLVEEVPEKEKQEEEVPEKEKLDKEEAENDHQEEDDPGRDQKQKEETEDEDQQEENQQTDDDDDEEPNTDKFYDNVSLSDNIRSLTSLTARVASSRSGGTYSNPIAQLAREHNASHEDAIS